MDSRQEAKLNMYHAVINYCNANSIPIASVPALANVLAAIRPKVSSIVTTAQLEAQVTSGVATDKKVMRDNLCRQAADIAAAVFPYAVSIGNNTLKEQVAFSKSELRILKDDLLAPTCRNIHDLANTNLVALADYGITAPMLASLNALIASYEAKVPTPRNAASLKKTYATNLKTLFKECDSIFKNQMDKLVIQIKAAFPDFYNTYKNNRIILDAATSSTQVAGTVTNSATGNPINGVGVSVEGQTYNAKTNASGNYVLKIPVPGSYTIIFTKAGFQDNKVNDVEVKLGQSATLNVTLNV